MKTRSSGPRCARGSEGRPEGRLGGEEPLAVEPVDDRPRSAAPGCTAPSAPPSCSDGSASKSFRAPEQDPPHCAWRNSCQRTRSFSWIERDGLGQRHAESGAVRLAHHSLGPAARPRPRGYSMPPRGPARRRAPRGRRGERVEEALGPLEHLAALAPADVAAIDQQQDQPASRSVLVAAEVRRAGPGRRGRLEVAAYVPRPTEAAGLPSTSISKSPGPSPSTGRPSASTTLASTATTSTPTPNTGLRRSASGACAAPRRKPPGSLRSCTEPPAWSTSPGPSRR